MTAFIQERIVRKSQEAHGYRPRQIGPDGPTIGLDRPRPPAHKLPPITPSSALKSGESPPGSVDIRVSLRHQKRAAVKNNRVRLPHSVATLSCSLMRLDYFPPPQLGLLAYANVNA